MFAARSEGYTSGAADQVNLADPNYEPSDEDLARLMRTAFAGTSRAREESLRAMQARILDLQAEPRARFEAWLQTLDDR